MITNTQIMLIRKSWRQFMGIEPAVIADLFYSKLFADNPGIRKLFPRQMEAQYVKLIDMLNTIISRLPQLDALTDDLAAMAQRHTSYGTKPVHYKLVGKALVWTLRQGLGKEWNTELEEAWLHCYTVLSNIMINASIPANDEFASSKH
ncbi:MAG: globin domain-containing protein [Bacteroidota bacterium]